jgi:hypothetical protein
MWRAETLAPPLQVPHAAQRDEMVRRLVQYVFELFLRLIESSELHERAAKGDVPGKIVRMMFEARAADTDGLFELAEAEVFIGELGKKD